ncbi:hypothetical protein BH24ACT4_BH24ACT4_08720 [soil metagenome]
MATMWRKAMLYLGLGPDEEYDDYDPGYDDPAPPARPSRSGATPDPMPSPDPEPGHAPVGPVRPMAPVRSAEPAGDFASQVGAAGGLGRIEAGGGGVLGATPRPKMVRPMPVASTARPRLVVPNHFNQAQEVADSFKGDQPVVMNLRHADREVSRRLIDFSSGLCYGLGGRMDKLDSQVYLLSPANVEVSEDERDRLRQRGYED